MKRQSSFVLVIALVMTAALGAQQTGVNRGRRGRARRQDGDPRPAEAGRRRQRRAGRRHERAALGRRTRRRRARRPAGLRRRQHRRGDAHRPVHAAPSRRQDGQSRGGESADQGGRRRQCEVESERRHADAPGRAGRQRRRDQPAGRRQGRRQRPRSRVGTDAADFRGIREPRRSDHHVDQARRRSRISRARRSTSPSRASWIARRSTASAR